MKLTFLGAARCVTGSRFLLETDGERVLIDSGLFQERENRHLNWEKFPVDPKSISAVLLTHAHIDHCGYLPRLVAEGFKGKIYCTGPTLEITKISLLDSASLQEADAAYKLKRHKKEGRKGPYPEAPLYTIDDARRVFSLLNPITYHQKVSVTSRINATYFEAGHILGAAMIEVNVLEGGKSKRIIFSGDIGRPHRPILKDPTFFAQADVVVMEATYGDRLHEGEKECLDKLARVIIETVAQKGNVIIPTFAIERAQELLYDLKQLIDEKKIPPVTTFVDSPMAIDVIKVFDNYPEYLDQEAKDVLKQYRKLFDFPKLKFTATPADSKTINNFKGSALIMAGSGMCTGGRIKFHLVNNISQKRNTILFVGYQAEGTLGRIILERPKSVRILGEVYDVNARIEKINGFSAHADRDDLIKWISAMRDTPQKVFIVHSEKNVAATFSQALAQKSSGEVIVPALGQTYQLN